MVTPAGREEESITRLARVGYDNTLGYLKGGFETWKNAGFEYDTVNWVTANSLEELMEENVPIFDVRKEGEFTAEHVDGARFTPLDFINDYITEFPKEEEFYVHCAGGYRSVIVASILKARGYHNVVNILGGFASIKKTSIKITNYVCP